ncbi:uncharacterized protein DSM5745_10828 [Aspergillus mulundensis]|uniref:Leucine rich repeat protein n=1 Tax=Aspergillus mulundensis TaxID=1810919 RepID=A0A3D8QFE3_9EURO|nr:hypothetical protein DSM5745_10828 [Aspergillus mulundensis]RDW60370.1 hypothetical protein DSM5745_10828 [Aspergillus mulundensis]
MALRGAASNGASTRTYNTRLLIAEREPNTTSQGIAETLLRFPELIYLDLSYTTSAKDQTVLSTLSQLERLQVLKLRGIGLKDVDAAFLANAIGYRVRLLDLRDNKLTDMALQSLLHACFLPPGHDIDARGQHSRTLTTSSPNNHFSFQSPCFLRAPGLDQKFQESLTSLLTGRSWVEDLPNVGITHLYLAGNEFTVDGAASLLATSRLHVLDIGTLDKAQKVSGSQLDAQRRTRSGSEQLIPILGTVAKDNLAYLRAHHAICTSTAPKGSPISSDDFLPELSGGNRTAGFSELDTHDTQLHELPADTTPVFELAGSTPRPQSPDKLRNNGENPSGMEHTHDRPIAPRRDSTFAPEVLIPNDSDASTMTSPSDTYAALSCSPIPRYSSPLSMEDPRARKIQELLAKRPKSQPRREGRESYVHYLHPFHIPHLEVLVLTDVPSHVPATSPILESLIQFITACSNEALLATLQAGSDYSLPPGKDRAKAEQERAKSLFGLRQLVLEITPVTNSLQPVKSTGWKPGSQIGQQKSATGDWELERLWSAASDDFSFFGETECGIPTEDNALMPDANKFSSISAPSAPSVPVVDLVCELAAFRRRKKLEYVQAVRHTSQRRSTNNILSPQSSSRYSAGSAARLSPSPSTTALSPVPGPNLSIAHHVEGHWKGEVKIVRNATPKGRSGWVDLYGNYFEKGYLYP